MAKQIRRKYSTTIKHIKSDEIEQTTSKEHYSGTSSSKIIQNATRQDNKSIESLVRSKVSIIIFANKHHNLETIFPFILETIDCLEQMDAKINAVIKKQAEMSSLLQQIIRNK